MFLRIQVTNKDGKKVDYIITFTGSEDIEIKGLINKMVQKVVVYCRDKSGAPFKFLAEEIERYD